MTQRLIQTTTKGGFGAKVFYHLTPPDFLSCRIATKKQTLSALKSVMFATDQNLLECRRFIFSI